MLSELRELDLGDDDAADPAGAGAARGDGARAGTSATAAFIAEYDDSVLDESRLVTVEVAQGAGPLRATLAWDELRELPVVQKWERAPGGAAGPLEATGRVRPGDEIVSVDGAALAHLPGGFAECLGMIRDARKIGWREHRATVLVFRRPLPPPPSAAKKQLEFGGTAVLPETHRSCLPTISLLDSPLLAAEPTPYI